MDQSRPGKIAAWYDLGAMLKESPRLYLITEIHVAQPSYLRLILRAMVHCMPAQASQFVIITCVNAVDFAVRPPNAAILMGGPFIEYQEQNPELEQISQYIPNCDDGKRFDPPVKFTQLRIDQTYIIAERFELGIENEHVFREKGSLEQQPEPLKRFKEWIEKFRIIPSRRVGNYN